MLSPCDDNVEKGGRRMGEMSTKAFRNDSGRRSLPMMFRHKEWLHGVSVRERRGERARCT